MKIKQEHYEYIKQEIKKNWRYSDQIKQAIKNAKNYKDFNKRFRWDMFWLAGLSKYASDNLYTYCNDDHIDTVLRKIIKELENEQ